MRDDADYYFAFNDQALASGDYFISRAGRHSREISQYMSGTFMGVKLKVPEGYKEYSVPEAFEFLPRHIREG